MLRYVVWSKLKQFVFHYVGRGLILFTLFVNFSGGTRISALIFKEAGAGLWTTCLISGKQNAYGIHHDINNNLDLTFAFETVVPQTVRLEVLQLAVALPILSRMIFTTTLWNAVRMSFSGSWIHSVRRHR